MASITSGQVGTAVVTGAGALKNLAITMPIPLNADDKTPLTLIDAVPANPVGPLLFSARVSDLGFLYMLKPNSVPLPPDVPAAPPAGTVMAGQNIAFTKGLYVASCPANVTFTAT